MQGIWHYVKQFMWKLWLANFLGSLTTFTIMILFMLSLIYVFIYPDQSVSFHGFSDLLHPITFLFILLVLLSISFQFAGLYATAAEVSTDGIVRIRTYFIKGSTYTLKLLSIYMLMWVPSVSAIALVILMVKIKQFFHLYIEIGLIVVIFWFFVVFISPILIFFMCVHAPLLMIIEQQKTLRALLSSARISWQNGTDFVITSALSICATLFVGVFSSIVIIPLIQISTNSDGIFSLNSIIWLIGIAVILSLCLATFGLIITYRYITSFRQQCYKTDSENVS